MTTTVTVTPGSASSATVTAPSTATPSISSPSHANVTLPAPVTSLVTISNPDDPTSVQVIAVPTINAVVTHPAVSATIVPPVPLAVSMSTTTGVAVSISGQGPQGIPGNVVALREYWLSDYGGGANKTAAENDLALMRIQGAIGGSTGTWYANINECGMIRFAGPCKFSMQWDIPKHCGLKGLGMTLSALIPQTTDAQVTFSTRTNSGYRCAESGDFTIDGAGIASTVPLLYLGKMAEGAFTNINVVNAHGDGILCEATQNILFTNVNAQDCGNNGITLDYGVGGCVFVRCEFGGSGRYHLEMLGTGPFPQTPPGVGTETSLTFIGCIFERGTSTTLGMIKMDVGLRNRFQGCVFAATGLTQTWPMIQLDGANSLHQFHTEFQSCSWSGNGTGQTALAATNGCSLAFTDLPVISGCGTTPLAIDGTCTVHYGGDIRGLAAAPETSLSAMRVPSTLRINRTTTGDRAITIFNAAEANARYTQFADGTQTWGPGTAGTDVNWRRAGGPFGARLKTDQQAAFGGGTAGTGVRIGDKGLWVWHDTATATWDPANVTNLGTTSTTVALSGALVGDVCSAAFSVALPVGALLFAAVTAADVVTVTLANLTGADLDLGSGTLRVTVDRH